MASKPESPAAEDLLRELDDAARRDLFPTWEHAHLTIGAMRATGIVRGAHLGLVFETLAFDRREQLIRTSAFAFGPAAGRRGFVATIDEVIPTDELVEEIGELEVRSRVTGERLVFDERGRSTSLPPPSIPTEVTLRARGKKLTLPLSLPRGLKVDRSRLHPNEVVLFQLVETVPPDQLFTPWKKLAAAVGAEKGARVVLRTEAWEHPAHGQAPSQAKGIRAMVHALAEGEAPPPAKKPNTRYRDWLDELMEDRTEKDERRWATAAAAPGADRPKPQPKRPAAAKSSKLGAPAWIESARIHPSFGNDSFPCGAIRARGFTSPSGPALVLQALIWSPATATISRETYAYGPGAKLSQPAGFVVRTPLVPAADLQAWLSKGGGPRRGQSLQVALGKERHTVSLTPPDVPKAELMPPGEVLLYAMVQSFPRDVLFPTSGLAGEVGLHPKATEQFVRDAFQSARLGKPVTDSPDLVAMARAVEDGAPLAKSLPGKPDAGPLPWLSKGVKKRPPSKLAWASG